MIFTKMRLSRFVSVQNGKGVFKCEFDGLGFRGRHLSSRWLFAGCK
jgi:hypothetical protein